MKSLELRQRFFQFFEKKGHTHVASSSLIPAGDPTLLFANAGMNQFKDVFLGNEKRRYTRAVSIQKCMRAGGKHNDLDNVGFTSRHLTFFEMMGNFSFGDYFKKEAIAYAWEFLTKEIGLTESLLHASVFYQDQESYDIWHEIIGLPQEKIHRLGAQDNFWQMGDTGPCGPCTEIYVDRGPHVGCQQASCSPACGCDRFLEVWNLVFMQYDRQSNGTDVPLKQTGVDTGMGLERLCVITQRVESVFNTDVFTRCITAIEQATGKIYTAQHEKEKAAFHVLCDHIRSSSLLIADGCAPSNDGRGYVLRKIIRRAALFAQKLTDKNIFPALSRVVVDDLGSIYPELHQNKELIYTVLESEVQKFADNLVRGKAVLERFFQENKDTQELSGPQAFKLYDTFGFPIELITLIAQERGFRVDMKSFAQEMHKQQLQSGKKNADELTHVTFDTIITTEFTGYQELETTADVIALVHDTTSVSRIEPGKECWVITRRSPFFIVGGGQVPDRGWLSIQGHRTPVLEVRFIDTAIAAHVRVPVALSVGDEVTSSVDAQWRTNAMKNHTATHMLQAALMQLFGKQIKQSGSLVHPDYLRFDFTYHKNLSSQEIKEVEDLVNAKIRENIPVQIIYTDMKSALDHGALAFFGDKYNPENVRMVLIPHFSTELCGGTHVHATGDIGTFKITEMSSPAAGHRRIVAVTGPKAIELFQESFTTIKTLCTDFKVQREELQNAVTKQREHLKELQAHLKNTRKQLWTAQLSSWQQQVRQAGTIPYLVVVLQNYTLDELRDIAQALVNKQPGFYFLITQDGDKQIFVSALSPALSHQISLKEFGIWLKDTYSLSGGGSTTLLQGGGSVHSYESLETAIHAWLMRKN